MPMSERERRVLDELELDFASAPARAPSARLALSDPKRLMAGVIGSLSGLLPVVLGVALGNAVGVVLAVASFLLIVAAVAVVLDCTSTTSVDAVRRPWARRYFR